MSSNNDFLEQPGLRVTVDHVVFNAEFATSPEYPYCFVYFISIHNDTDLPVTFKGRKWVITNSNGEVTAIEADGIVGLFPTINPGQKFSYNSFHLLDTPSAVAEGSYLGMDTQGCKIIARIPQFKMVVPKF